MRFMFPVLFIPFVELSVGSAEDHQEQLRRAKDMMQSHGKLCFESIMSHEADTLERAIGRRHNRIVLNEQESRRQQKRELQVRLGERQWSQYAPEDKCIVCFEKECNAMSISCGHRVLCKECAEAVEQTSGNCPLCRARGRAVVVR